MQIQLHMATVNTCNAKCGFCMYPKPENTYPKGVMDMDLFRKIIDDAAEIPVIDQVAFSALGEPLLDRHIVERVQYVKDKCPDWPLIELYTNGVALTPKMFERLKAAGLNGLSISLNAVTPEQHEERMGLVGLFDRVCDNADYAIAWREDMKVLVKTVFSGDDFDRGDAAAFYARWGLAQMGGHGQAVIERNWAGGTRTLEGEIPDPNAACGRALGQISVLWDGTVSLCCFDPLARHNLGDLKKQSIREVYNAEWYTQFREDHSRDQAAKYEICANCTRV